MTYYSIESTYGYQVSDLMTVPSNIPGEVGRWIFKIDQTIEEPSKTSSDFQCITSLTIGITANIHGNYHLPLGCQFGDYSP